jgi:hypothetical protein
LLWYHQCFDELGKPHGIQTNYSKTKVLTSTTGSSPYLSQFVSPWLTVFRWLPETPFYPSWCNTQAHLWNLTPWSTTGWFWICQRVSALL